MARLIKKSDRVPFEIKPSEQSKWVCMCGLSKNQPFCDGAHKSIIDEEENKVYKYNKDGTREEVNEN